MKWYNQENYIRYKNDIEVKKNDPISKIYPHVINIANTYSRDYVATGILDINDLIQAGNTGLLEAWSKVDWMRIEESPNPQGELWSFLKIRIKGAIRREIDSNGSFVSIPNHIQEKARKDENYKLLNKTLVNTFPRFFDQEVIYKPDIEPYVSLQLEAIIEDYMIKHFKNYDHIDILLSFYGIGKDKMSVREISNKYVITEANVKVITHRLINKMKSKELEEMIDNLYKNM